MSQKFCYHCVEYIKLHICAKFHDHWSNNNKVMMGGGGGGDMDMDMGHGRLKKAHVK